MLISLNILSVVLLVITIVQDFLYRAIYWWLCPVLALVLIAGGLLQNDDISFMLICWLVNIAVVTVQLLAIWLYSLARKKRTGRNLLQSFGLGDVLCLYAFCFLCQPYLLVVLYCVSYIVALLTAFIFPAKFKEIPLAGWLSVGAFLLIAYSLALKVNLWDMCQFMLDVC